MTVLRSLLVHALARPHDPAVIDANLVTTWRDLMSRARHLAGGLRRAGVVAGDRIAVVLPPGRDAVAAAMAAFMCRSAYVPIDPEQPVQRARLMLTRCSPAVVVDNESVEPLAAGPPITMAGIDTGMNDDVAYVIHTSGSTGVPKAVQVEHGSLVNLLSDIDRRAPVPPVPVGSAWCSPDFDVAVWETWAPLVHGGALAVVPARERLDADAFARFLDRVHVTTAYMPPSFLAPFWNYLRDHPDRRPAVRRLLVGVEPIALGLLQNIMAACPGLQILNGYGPAEATICCTLYAVPASGGDPAGRTPIGTPVAGMTIDIVDPNLDGIGELVVSGIGVARGYLDPADDAAGRFVGRSYRTGDLVSSRPDGLLEFAGRADRQLKVRGLRVEAGEVEAAVRAGLGVAEVHIDLRDGQEPELAAYVVADRAPTVSEINRLSTRLPRLAIPTVWVPLRAMPLTRNGKVDRDALRALAAPEAVGIKRSESDPPGAHPDWLTALWRRALGTAAAGRFVDLGGTSLTAVRVAAEVRRRTGREVTGHDVLTAASPQGLYEVIAGCPPLPAGGEAGATRSPLAPNQITIWMHDQILPPGSYREALAFELAPDIALDRLADAFARATAAHPAFGAAIDVRDGPELVLGRHEIRLAVQTTDRPLDAAELGARALSGPMDPARDPLLQAEVVVAGTRRVLLLVWHHVVVDGWSARLFLRDLGAYYLGQHRGYDRGPVTICDLNLRTLDALGDGAARAAEVAERLRGVDSLSAVAGPPQVASFRVPLPNHRGVTTFAAVADAYRVALTQTLGSRSILVGAMVAGRHQAESLEVAGCLVETVILRLDSFPAVSDESRREAAAEIAHATAAQHGLGFGTVVAAARRLGLRPPIAYLSVDETYRLEHVGKPLDVHLGRPKFPLTLTALIDGPELSCVLEVGLDTLDKRQFEGLLAALTRTLRAN
jgi:amino acid adenylation domain-containing protein